MAKKAMAKYLTLGMVAKTVPSLLLGGIKRSKCIGMKGLNTRQLTKMF